MSFSFPTQWQECCQEADPSPYGSAGKLLTALGDLLRVEQVAYEKVERTALFLLNLSTLGLKGMDLNVVMVSHPPQDDGTLSPPSREKF